MYQRGMESQFLFTAIFLVLLASNGYSESAKGPEIQFEITMAEKAEKEISGLGFQVPVVGRVFAIVSSDGEKEPRLSTGVLGEPLWGMDVRGFSAGSTVTITDGKETVRSYPLEATNQLPAGEYYVQAFLNIYTTFHKSDGHTVEMHLNSGAHQRVFHSPGNIFSKVKRITVNPGDELTIDLPLTEVIQPNQPLKDGEVLQQGNYDDTDWVKYIKIKSEKVSKFWGQDMYLGANVLLPPGYAEHPEVSYPVLYLQGHSSGLTPVPWSPEEWFYSGHTPTHPAVGNQLDGFFEAWSSGACPKFIVVTFRDSNPFFDTSYSVNSANVGPYGDAIMEELIPYLESNFRIIRKPWARVIAGRSTGGWEAAAMMIFNPDFFAASWPWAPDPIDFRKNMQINIYQDKNAFFNQHKWIKTAHPGQREIDGLINYTVQNEFRYETTVASKDRSGGQWAIWQAVYSPEDSDGYPTPLWDPETGEIDHQVAAYWKDNYDLSHILKRDWITLGPRLKGKLHFRVGMMDNYYLNEAVYLVQEFLESATNPTSEATFEYGFRGRHSWIGASPSEPERQITYAEFISVISDFVTKSAPQDADTNSWKY